MSKWSHGIYHEKQIGALCAVHALNNLMQQPMFKSEAQAASQPTPSNIPAQYS